MVDPVGAVGGEGGGGGEGKEEPPPASEADAHRRKLEGWQRRLPIVLASI